MRWSRPILVFKPDGTRPWSRSHAQVPTPIVLGDRLRVFYATRDAEGRSRTSFLDLATDDPRRILYVHPEPVMELGRPGAHDEDGVMVGSVVDRGDRLLMYYTGWSRGVTVPYRVAVGLAESRDGGLTFSRVFDGPVVDRTAREPFMTMSPYVMVDDDGLWRMWYGSGIGWVEVAGKQEPLYVVKHAESDDGLLWRQRDVTCIPQSQPLEANTRPSVMRNGDGYEMWFSYRDSRDFRGGSGGYRIGRAVSADGRSWTDRADPAGLEPGRDTSWASAMLAYPSVVEIAGRRLMFLNGDGFGRSGLGFCLEDDL